MKESNSPLFILQISCDDRMSIDMYYLMFLICKSEIKNATTIIAIYREATTLNDWLSFVKFEI